MSDRESDINEALSLEDYETAAVLTAESRYRGMEEAQVYATLALAKAIRESNKKPHYEHRSTEY